MSRVKYPRCRPFTGPAKVYCLINAIMDDYYNGRINADKAKSRLIYLIALNKRNNWMSEDALRSLVYEALGELPIYVGGRLSKSMMKYAMAF